MRRTFANFVVIVILPILVWVGASVLVDYQSFKGACGIFGVYNSFYTCGFGQYLLGGQTLPAILWVTLLWASFSIPLWLLQKPILAAFRARRYLRGLAYSLVILLVGTPFELFIPLQILLKYYRW